MDSEASPPSQDEETIMLDQIPKSQRSLRSLNVLATKFIKLLQEAEDGVLDLKHVSELRSDKQHKQQPLIPPANVYDYHKHQYSYTYQINTQTFSEVSVKTYIDYSLCLFF